MPTPPPYEVLLARDFLSIHILLASCHIYGNQVTLSRRRDDALRGGALAARFLFTSKL